MQKLRKIIENPEQQWNGKRKQLKQPQHAKPKKTKIYEKHPNNPEKTTIAQNPPECLKIPPKNPPKTLPQPPKIEPKSSQDASKSMFEDHSKYKH